jgi:hypothetical protein
VPNAVVNSVEPDEIGIASGTSATLREVGGVFGVALIATAFAHPGNYTSRPTFVHNFSHAMWVAAALSAFGVLVALVARGRSKAEQEPELLIAANAAGVCAIVSGSGPGHGDGPRQVPSLRLSGARSSR